MPHNVFHILASTFHNLSRLPIRIYDPSGKFVAASIQAPIFEIPFIEYNLHDEYKSKEISHFRNNDIVTSTGKIKLSENLYIWYTKIDDYLFCFGPFINDDIFQFGVDENRLFYDEIGNILISEMESIFDRSFIAIDRRIKRFLQKREFLIDEEITDFIVSKRDSLALILRNIDRISEMNHSVEIEWSILSILERKGRFSYSVLLPKVNTCKTASYAIIDFALMKFDIHKDDNLPEIDDSFYSVVGSYQKARNLIYLEYFLVLRLWFQDNIVNLNVRNSFDITKFFDKVCFLILQHINSNTTILYRYDYALARLKRLGVAADSEQRKIVVEEHVLHVEEAEKEAQNDMRVYEVKKTLNEINIPNTEGEFLFLTDDLQKPQYVYLIPLLFRGKIWGVFEIHGAAAYQFADHHIRWVKEILRAITPALFDKWLLDKIRSLAEITAAKNDVSNDRYRDMAPIICDILLADSAAVYIQNFNRRHTFECMSACGRSREYQGKRISYDVRKRQPGNLSLNVHKPWADAYHTDVAGCPPEWRNKGHIAKLIGEGHNYFSFIPIRMGDETPVATVTISSQAEQPYNMYWNEIITIISEFVSSNIKIIYYQYYDEELFYQSRVHVFQSKVRRIEKTAPQVMEIIERLGISNYQDLISVQRMFEDIEISLTLASKYSVTPKQSTRARMSKFISTIVSLRDNSENIFKPISDFVQNVQELKLGADRVLAKKSEIWNAPALYDGSPSSLRIILLSSIKSRLMNRGNEIHAPEFSVLNGIVAYDAPRDLIANLFENVIDNAIKYDAIGDTVIVGARVMHEIGEVHIYVRNHAYILPEEVRNALSLRRIEVDEKGVYAGIEGSGLGLYQLRKLSGLWGFELVVKPAVSSTLVHRGMDVGRHETVIIFRGNRLELD